MTIPVVVRPTGLCVQLSSSTILRRKTVLIWPPCCIERGRRFSHAAIRRLLFVVPATQGPAAARRPGHRRRAPPKRSAARSQRSTVASARTLRTRRASPRSRGSSGNSIDTTFFAGPGPNAHHVRAGVANPLQVTPPVRATGRPVRDPAPLETLGRRWKTALRRTSRPETRQHRSP